MKTSHGGNGGYNLLNNDSVCFLLSCSASYNGNLSSIFQYKLATNGNVSSVEIYCGGYGDKVKVVKKFITNLNASSDRDVYNTVVYIPIK